MRKLVELSANKHGLNVFLHPVLTYDHGDESLLGALCFAPDNPDQFFATLETPLLQMAKLLAPIATTTAITIALELPLTVSTPPPQWAVSLCGSNAQPQYDYDNAWRQLAQRVRVVTSNGVTPTALVSYAAIPLSASSIQFWDAMDFIGLEWYLPMNASADVSPSIDVMTEQTLQHLKHFNNAVRVQRNLSQPIVWTEVGVPSYTGAAATPFSAPTHRCDSVVANLTAQDDAYSALLQAVQFSLDKDGTDVLAGAFFYAFDNSFTSDSYPNGRLWPCFFTPRGKPALQTLTKQFLLIGERSK